MTSSYHKLLHRVLHGGCHTEDSPWGNEPGRASSGGDREPGLIIPGPVVGRLRSCLLELHPLRTPRVREVRGQMWCAPGWPDQCMIGVDVPPSSASRLSSFMLS